MGQGSKFYSVLGTRGGRPNFITEDDIASGDKMAKDILGEMKKEGIKFSKDKIVFAARLENGNKLFLEKDALDHIIKRHSTQFEKTFGVGGAEISNLLSETLSRGKLVSSEYRVVNGVKYYSSKYYFKGRYSIVYGIAENGYIETAYPKGGIR